MQQVLLQEHRHFVGAAHSFEVVTAKDPIAGQYVRPDVTILKTFFIDDTVNANDWQATWEGLKKDAEELPGVPLVLQEDLEHPKFSVQQYYDRGTIFDYEIDEEKKRIIVYVRITDPKIVARIKSGELEYVSPAVIPRGSESLRNVKGVDILDRTLPLHLAIVGNPAYGKEKAKMTHMCSGDGEACYHRLKIMTANVDRIIQREHELLDKGIPEDEVHEMLKKEFGKLAEGHGDGGNSGIKSKLKIHNAEGIPELEQTPYIKKLIAANAKIASVLNQHYQKSKYPIHNGMEGHWIYAKGMDVFVARNQSIESAILDQCGCAKLGATLDGKEGEWITVRGTHIFIIDGQNPNTVIKKHFEELEKKDKEKSKDKPKQEEKQKETPKKPEKESKNYPMGNSKEDKQKRKEHFKEDEKSNTEIGELNDEIRYQTLDRNMAQVELSRAKRNDGDIDAAQKKLSEEQKKLDGLKSERDSKVDELKNGGILEGLEAQRALAHSKREREEAARHKPGSKVEMKHLMNAMSMDLRVDLIRTGKIPDKTITGINPYGKSPDAAPKQKQEPVVEKSFRVATSDDLKGFKHNIPVKLRGDVDSGHLREVKGIINDLDAKDLDIVKNIVIKKSTATRGGFTMGEWVDKTGTLNVTTHDSLTRKDYVETINHEVGHIDYRKKSPEQITAWQKAVETILPPTNYAKQHRDRARNYVNTWKNTARYMNADDAEKQIIDNNHKAFFNLYYEEIHSEVVSHLRSGGLKQSKIYSKGGLDSAVKSYKEIF